MQRPNAALPTTLWLGPLIGAVIGLVIGLLIGWVILPVGYSPNADDVAAMADAYEANPTTGIAYAKSQLAGLSRDQQSQLFTTAIARRTASNRPIEAGRIATLAQALNIPIGPAASVTPLPGATAVPGGAAPGTTAAATPNSTFLPLLLLLIVIVLLVAAALVFLTRILPQMRTTQVARRTVTTTTPAPSQPAPAVARPASARPVAPVAPTAPTTTPGGLGRFVASYTLGNDNYDTSFSLETTRQEFLGECGMGISETIGEGKPDKVTAFDLWLFDKADVRTVTQIIMSDYAYNDQGLRAKLAAKGEAILAEKGRTVQLETQSLRIAAQIVELVYASNPAFPPNSHFQKLTVEIVPSLKEAVAA